MQSLAAHVRDPPSRRVQVRVDHRMIDRQAPHPGPLQVGGEEASVERETGFGDRGIGGVGDDARVAFPNPLASRRLLGGDGAVGGAQLIGGGDHPFHATWQVEGPQGRPGVGPREAS